MKTYRITEKDIEGMPVLATGYKIFKNDWTTRGTGYDFKDENGNVLNTIHKFDGELSRWRWGLNFSRLSYHCFDGYASVPWNQFAKVEAYGDYIDSGKNSIATILKVVKVYSFNRFVLKVKDDLQSIKDGNRLLDRYDIKGGNDIEGGNYIHGGNSICGCTHIYGSNNIWGGNYIHGGNNICGGHNIDGGNKIRGGNDICGGHNIEGGNDIRGGNCIWGSDEIRGGNNIWGCNDIHGGNYIYGGNDIMSGHDIHGGNCIYGGNNIKGGNEIRGGYDIWGALKCEGISRCIFCYNFTGKLHAFNKPISEDRFNEITSKLNSFNWFPKYTNAEQLKGDLEWHETDIFDITSVDNKIAWSFMPTALKEYIQSLPEYDEEIFLKITGNVNDEDEVG